MGFVVRLNCIAFGASLANPLLVDTVFPAEVLSDSDQISKGVARVVICLVIIACSGFGAGVLYRFSASVIFILLSVDVAVVASAVLHYRQAYAQSLGSGFSYPGVPIVPCVCIFFNIFLFAQLHYEAWIRFVVVNVLATTVYALYGQYHADTSTLVYQRAPETESDSW